MSDREPRLSYNMPPPTETTLEYTHDGCGGKAIKVSGLGVLGVGVMYRCSKCNVTTLSLDIKESDAKSRHHKS